MPTKNDTKVVDWRIPSAITRDDMNYWDKLHDRRPIGKRISDELAPAVLEGHESTTGVIVSSSNDGGQSIQFTTHSFLTFPKWECFRVSGAVVVD